LLEFFPTASEIYFFDGESTKIQLLPGLLGMGVLDFGGDRRRERGSLGVNTMQKWRTDRRSTRVWKIDNISLRTLHRWILWTMGSGKWWLFFWGGGICGTPCNQWGLYCI